LLDKAKDEAYKKGFHEGTMLIGNFKGQKVCDAKNLVKNQMIEEGLALKYY
jgi:leucyl-tRNA synthetase